MKVEKIVINRKLIDINNPNYKEVILPPISAQICDEGDFPDAFPVNVTEINYEVKKVYNGTEEKQYLVKVDDNGIFDDLLKIGKKDIEQMINKQVNKYKEFFNYEMITHKYLTTIRLENNPLWRRIFKKFK